MPSLEAVLAGTLALMTGYSQALQADQAPAQRVLMGNKIGRNLGLLIDHPAFTEAFRRVLSGLQTRWQQMGNCTELAAPACVGDGRAPCVPDHIDCSLVVPASKRVH